MQGGANYGVTQMILEKLHDKRAAAGFFKRAGKVLAVPLAFVGAFVVVQFMLTYVGVEVGEAKAGALIAALVVASAMAHSLSQV